MKEFQGIDPNGAILERILVFCRKYGIPNTKFGQLVIGDAHLVDDLKKGRNLTLKTAHRIDQFIEAANVHTE